MPPTPESLATKQRVDELIQATANWYEVGALPDLTDQVNHNGKLSVVNLSIEPQSLLLAQYALEPQTAQLSYNDKRLLRLGKENSQHAVHFGRLAVIGANGDHITDADVAVKYNIYPRALGEMAMLQYVASLGLPAYEPFGIMTPNDSLYKGRFYMLTKFHSGIKTMDVFKWHEYDDEKVASHVQRIAAMMATLHGNGLHHGDMYMKNIGQNDIGDTFVVDFEYMTSLRDIVQRAHVTGDDDAVEDICTWLYCDFMEISSVIQDDIARLRNMTGSAAEDLFYDNLVSEYRTAMQHQPYADLFLSVCDTAITRVKNTGR